MPPKPVYLIHHHPEGFASRSGFPALIEALGAKEIPFTMRWRDWSRRSWSFGEALRQWGIRHTGSTWSGLTPYVDEWRMARQVQELSGAVVHFIWGEFSSPRHSAWFRKRGNRLVSTFHCSIRRLPKVLGNFRCWDAYDACSVKSKTQLNYSGSRGSCSGYPGDADGGEYGLFPTGSGVAVSGRRAVVQPNRFASVLHAGSCRARMLATA